MISTGVRGILLLAIARGALDAGDVHGVEQKPSGQENYVSRAVFAAGRLWLLTDAGDLSTVTPDEKTRVHEVLPEPAIDMCVVDGRPAVLTCRRTACDEVTFRRWAAGKWTSDAPVPLEGDHVAAVACFPGGHAILTDRRLIESINGTASVRRLSHPGTLRMGLVTSLHVTAKHVVAGVNAGEWGGGLVRIDRATGAATRIERNVTGELCGGPLNTGCDPVNGIAAEPWKPGCFAAAVGLVHFGPRGRMVEVCDEDVRASFVKPIGSDDARRPLKHRETVAFFGLTRVGRTLIAAGVDGLYRFDGSADPRYAPLPKFDAIGGVGVSFAVPNVALVLTAINRRRSISGNVPLVVSRIAESRPYPWFEATFPKLPRMVLPQGEPARGRTVQTKDGVSMRLGAAYGPRNDSCWAAQTEKWPGPGWRDVCLTRQDRELLHDDFRLRPATEGERPSSPPPRVIDLVVYDSWKASAGMLRDRRAIIERARASGGMAGHKRVRTLEALIEIGPGEWVTFTGETGDDAGYDELMAIAATIEPAWP